MQILTFKRLTFSYTCCKDYKSTHGMKCYKNCPVPDFELAVHKLKARVRLGLIASCLIKFIYRAQGLRLHIFNIFIQL